MRERKEENETFSGGNCNISFSGIYCYGASGNLERDYVVQEEFATILEIAGVLWIHNKHKTRKLFLDTPL